MLVLGRLFVWLHQAQVLGYWAERAVSKLCVGLLPCSTYDYVARCVNAPVNQKCLLLSKVI